MGKRIASLADAVMAQRGRLGLTQEELAAKAGISVDTVQAIEHGHRTTFRTRTKAALEGALGWAPGSIDAIAAGGTPTIDTREPARPTIPGMLTIDPDTASHVDLGRVADWISATSRDPALGERWMRRILDRRALKARKAASTTGETQAHDAM